MSNSSANVSIIDLPAMTVAGLGSDFISASVKGTNAFSVLPKLWAEVSAAVEVAAFEGKSIYDFKAWMVGAMGEPEFIAYADVDATPDVDGLMHYFAGVRVDGLPDGLTQALLAAGLKLQTFVGGAFAACEHVGPLDTLGATTEWFYKNWLPSEGPAVRFGHHFEIYDERFKMGSPSSVVLICAPV